MTGKLLPHRPLLLVLTGCAFLLGTGEIVIAGLLPEIAAELGISLPLAGALISVFLVAAFDAAGARREIGALR
ncbi:MFS transporter, DHA1 family, inner membrane transport protein [Saccharopolyspora kobensis]|uniref:MFS transporter, DHA1 family, inner membrane transport protein n=1 Tax=Saccharopolyspora kobensis TaxID=146035 RepID=A0A1H6DBL9_9PSEU|nr:MFS transporter [Saccharopolyspora kobensis]SEG82721.1 MFS transporter, DHA1 family, inner membrane transport protein [Saccharopolyspora kobensis]SFE25923.1 MFS transporter, DHA1 family, inner membrane transport protein [Saccharopolyspora kobensis]